MIGHGAEGFLTTGCGNNGPQDLGNVVAMVNVAWWEPEFRRLKGTAKVVTLFGCWTGAGSLGLALLREIACATGARAVAPTGPVWAYREGKIRLARGSRWQNVTCNGSAIALPQAMNLADVKRRFTAAGRREKTAASFGVALEVAYLPRDERRAAHFQGEAAEMLMQLVEPFPHVVPEGAGPLAVVTGSLLLTEMDRAGRRQERQFIVYADRLLQDTAQPELFYEGSRSFAEHLTGPDAPRGEDAPGGSIAGRA